MCVCVFTGVVHGKMWSDGESDQASGTSSDEVQSPVRVRMRNLQQRISNEVMCVQSEVSNTHSNTHVEPKLYIKLSKCCVSSMAFCYIP